MGKPHTRGRTEGERASKGNVVSKTKLNKTTNTKLRKIAERSEMDSLATFDCLMPHFNKANLISCFNELDGKKAIGIDEQTKEEYGLHLETNIEKLIVRMKSMSYRPQPVKEVFIQKDNGKPRPLGIACIEDKIVQMMTAKVLESIYEPIFHDSSYGFRPDRNCHQAIKGLFNFLFGNRKIYILDVDLENFFGSIEHQKLLALLRMKIKDETFLRYIARMLKSEISSNGLTRQNELGTVQGSICSPILANIYAHYCLDEWLERTARPKLLGKIAVFRYCDDLVICTTESQDAERVMNELPKRLDRFALKLNLDKTKIVTLDKFAMQRGEKQGTFDFLGLTFYLGRNLKRTILPKVKTSSKKMRKSLKVVWQWIKTNRHKADLKTLWGTFCSKIRGYVQYYGISHNVSWVEKFIRKATQIFFNWINRRSQKRSMSWEKFILFMKRFPLPEAKVCFRLF